MSVSRRSCQTVLSARAMTMPSAQNRIPALVFPLTLYIRDITTDGPGQTILPAGIVSPGMTGRTDPAEVNNEYSKQHSEEKCKLCIQ